MTLRSKLIFVAIGLIFANYLYQAFTGQNWHAATERSWFQAVALFLAYLCVGMTP